jgi:hypothetical protein
MNDRLIAKSLAGEEDREHHEDAKDSKEAGPGARVFEGTGRSEGDSPDLLPSLRVL